ncbi:MAG: 6-phospho-3-hexuloisomerase [Hoeflea sp.]|uniref:6-phospho-3-hexuloisomerase n=1 Tax=Hoeflea sp. TaxID=1940281 RepID=UPI00272FFB22|nr:6-phospho-3-hexuloisomerase [Hoeflea sp.]MDP2122731.1 6-phospho-3-hexuloisomerase [Hoeflea sp.]MDZ7603671.1 6-phospho-3-hexuloisomerase [Hoeflea sp.]
MSGFDQALSEIGAVLDRVRSSELERAVDMIASAKTIVAYGCGREGLQIQGLVMRLHHLGLNASMQGAMNTPPLGRGDLFLCSAGPGELSTVSALMGVARKAGAQILFLTAEPECDAARMADQVLVIPAQTMARDVGGVSILPMGSVYEGALFLLFEILVLKLKTRLGETSETMRTRHTNME